MFAFALFFLFLAKEFVVLLVSAAALAALYFIFHKTLGAKLAAIKVDVQAIYGKLYVAVKKDEKTLRAAVDTVIKDIEDFFKKHF